MKRLNSKFYVNATFCVLNLYFFLEGPSQAVGAFNLVIGLLCGYWAYEAATQSV